LDSLFVHWVWHLMLIWHLMLVMHVLCTHWDSALLLCNWTLNWLFALVEGFLLILIMSYDHFHIFLLHVNLLRFHELLILILLSINEIGLRANLQKIWCWLFDVILLIQCFFRLICFLCFIFLIFFIIIILLNINWIVQYLLGAYASLSSLICVLA
jgi:hypothetical protein